MATTPLDKQRPKVAPPSIGLADLRKSHRLTQAHVAEQVAALIDETFNAGSLSLIEGGHRGASAAVLAALEQVYGIANGALAVPYAPSHSRRKAS